MLGEQNSCSSQGRRDAVVLSHFTAANLSPENTHVVSLALLPAGKCTRRSHSVHHKASFEILLFPTMALLLRGVLESYGSWLTILALGSEGGSATPALSTCGPVLPASFLSWRISCLYLWQGSSTSLPCSRSPEQSLEAGAVLAGTKGTWWQLMQSSQRRR